MGRWTSTPLAVTYAFRTPCNHVKIAGVFLVPDTSGCVQSESGYERHSKKINER